MTDDTTRSSRHHRGKAARSQRRSASRPGQFGKGAHLETSSERHQGRVLAMQALFEIDEAQHPLDDIVARIRWGDTEVPASVQASPDEDELELATIPTAVAQHVESLVRGASAHREEIDPILQAAAPAFPIAQIAAVDRNVLRLAIYELYYQPDVPVKVVINEAVEIAKRFGGPKSGKFVNGVLGTVARQLPDDVRPT